MYTHTFNLQEWMVYFAYISACCWNIATFDLIGGLDGRKYYTRGRRNDVSSTGATTGRRTTAAYAWHQ